MEHLEQRQKLSIMFAIMAAMLFAALNQTIISTALPHMISDLGGIEYFSWIFTAYILAASVPAVVVGRLSDIYGRRPFILAGIAIFIFASVLCGLASGIIELIIYRIIQGVGGGIIMATSFTAVGDLFSPRERGRWQGFLGTSFGVASVFGPTLGGYIVDHWHWKWVFWVFIPVGIVAFVLIMILFPSVPQKTKQKIDYTGALLLSLCVIPLLLAATWAGQQYAWASWEIIGLLASAVIALMLFIFVERRASHPILPLQLFSNSVFSLSNVIVFVIGASMFGSLLYVPLYLQGVLGLSATVSGSMLMPMTLSLVAASILGGQSITRSGRYKNLAFFGLAVTAVGMYLLSTMNQETQLSVVFAYVMIVGLGLGIGMPVFNLSIQNAVDHGDLGVATATGQLFRQLGGTLGVALMGTVMAHTMHQQLEKNLENDFDSKQLSSLPRQVLDHMEEPQLLINPGQLAEVSLALSPDMQTLLQQLIFAMREALNSGLSNVFISGSIAMSFAVFLVLFLREIPLRDSNEKNTKTTKQKDNNQ
ncbi:MAG: MFS transporter [Gammaproteobacteria bacterium]|nr:MFS transporter [Gammaproteobacteria bacterium]